MQDGIFSIGMYTLYSIYTTIYYIVYTIVMGCLVMGRLVMGRFVYESYMYVQCRVYVRFLYSVHIQVYSIFGPGTDISC